MEFVIRNLPKGHSNRDQHPNMRTGSLRAGKFPHRREWTLWQSAHRHSGPSQLEYKQLDLWTIGRFPHRKEFDFQWRAQEHSSRSLSLCKKWKRERSDKFLVNTESARFLPTNQYSILDHFQNIPKTRNLIGGCLLGMPLGLTSLLLRRNNPGRQMCTLLYLQWEHKFPPRKVTAMCWRVVEHNDPGRHLSIRCLQNLVGNYLQDTPMGWLFLIEMCSIQDR